MPVRTLRSRRAAEGFRQECSESSQSCGSLELQHVISVARNRPMYGVPVPSLFFLSFSPSSILFLYPGCTEYCFCPRYLMALSIISSHAFR